MKPRIIMSDWPFVQVIFPGIATPCISRTFAFSGEQTALDGLRHILKHLHAIVRGETPPIYKGTAV